MQHVRKAYAKVNIGLDVLRKREDGYHELRMIMQTVDLYDTLTFTKTDEGISLSCTAEGLPCDERNIAYRAAALMMEHYKIPGGIEIHLQKEIPMAAGRAGGSTDAAAVLLGMNELYELGASKEELCTLGVKLGADVPYCVMGGTMLSEGIGEVLTPLHEVPACTVLICKPDFDVSTKYVYENLHANSLTEHPDIDGLIDAIERDSAEDMAALMENVLETVTERKYEDITTIKNIMKEKGAMKALMSGSGPTVFGLFREKETAAKAAEVLKNRFPAASVFVSRFIKPE